VVSAIAADIQVDRAAPGELSASFEEDLARPGDATYDGHRRVSNESIESIASRRSSRAAAASRT
jgi:hypothetical protein